MSEKPKRILFLCAHRSVRGLMAASLLVAYGQEAWDVWSAPASFKSEQMDLVLQALDEVQVPLLSAPQTAEPSFGLSWDEGIVLCSGAANQ